MKRSPKLPTGIALRVALARGLLWFERMVQAFLPAALVVAVFLLLSLFGLWPTLPGWLHVALLALFAGAVLLTCGRGLVGLRFPMFAEGIRYLELSNRAPHRPVTALTDSPAALLEKARGAWSLHLVRTMWEARKLRIRRPRAVFARNDPLALRVGLGILLAAGFAAFGSDTAARVADAFRPDFSGPGTVTGTLTAWVAPPGYTALPSIPLEAHGDPAGAQPVEVPAGSVLLVRVHGGSGSSHAAFATGDRTAFVQIDRDNAALEVPVDAGGAVLVRQGGEVLAHWNFDVIQDEAPDVRFIEPPSGTARGTLQLDVAAADDYGVRSLDATVVWNGEDLPHAQDAMHLELPVPARRSRDFEAVTYHDLAAHIWAGELVRIDLRATDARSQTGTDTVETRLPERRFDHPIAKALVQQRKKLAFDRAPVPEIAHALTSIRDAGFAYGDSARVRNALDSAVTMLVEEVADARRGPVLDLLWETAVWIEEGNFAEAEADFRAAQNALAEALQQETRPGDLEELLSSLEDNLMEYLEEMEEPTNSPDEDEAQADMTVPGGYDAEQNATRRELEDMIDEIVDLATTGAPDEAEDALQDLQEITENMERAGERMLAESDQSMDQRQAMMQQMQELMSDQEQLMEETFFQSARAGVADQESPGSGSFNTPEARQSDIRQELGEMMRELGEDGQEIPQELGQAEQAMRQAAQELQRNRAGLAADAQGQALDMLRLGRERLRPTPGGQGPSQVAGERPSEHSRQSRDPFGRVPPGDGSAVTGEVGIPTRPERLRAREIVEELRARAGDPAKSELDRDYATRLLDWY